MITLSKLASLAHVSVSTASKAFSMSPEVNEQTREMIFQVAKEQGCFKKFFNAKYPKYVIAVICPEYKSLFYSSALSLLQEYFSAHSCEVCVASTNFSPEKEADLLCPEFGFLCIAEGRNILAFKGVCTFIRFQQRTHDVKQRGLTDAGGALHGDKIPFADAEADILQRRDGLTHPVVLVNMFQLADFHISSPHLV